MKFLYKLIAMQTAKMLYVSLAQVGLQRGFANIVYLLSSHFNKSATTWYFINIILRKYV